MKTIGVELGVRRYDVHVGTGALAEAERMHAGRDAVVITDATVAAIYPNALRGLARIVVEAGESAKSLGTFSRIVDELLARGAERRTTIAGFGGGVVCDMAGFVAATVLRGMPFVLVPTTLLAQVDAAVGGKNGINWGSGKNLVGTIYQPRAVFADVGFMASLPEREYRAGLAEVVKMGAIRDAALFSMLEANVGPILARDANLLEELVARSVRGKADVVVADEHEAGLRRILNFGHTVGHAIEQATGYTKFLHGEAVSLGINAALRVGVELRITDAEAARRVTALCRAFGLPTDDASIDALRVADAMELDKKKVAGEIQFVFIRDVGDVVIVPMERARLSRMLWRRTP